MDCTDIKRRLMAEHEALVGKLFGTTRHDAWAYDQDGKPVLKVGDITSPMSEAVAAIDAKDAEIKRLRVALERLAREADVDSYADCRDAIKEAIAALAAHD